MDLETLAKANEANEELKKIEKFFSETGRGSKASIVQRAKHVFLKAETIGLSKNIEIEIFDVHRQSVLKILKDRELELKEYIESL